MELTAGETRPPGIRQSIWPDSAIYGSSRLGLGTVMQNSLAWTGFGRRREPGSNRTAPEHVKTSVNFSSNELSCAAIL
jgi:hypothetical protein